MKDRQYNGQKKKDKDLTENYRMSNKNTNENQE